MESFGPKIKRKKKGKGKKKKDERDISFTFIKCLGVCCIWCGKKKKEKK